MCSGETRRFERTSASDSDGGDEVNPVSDAESVDIVEAAGKLNERTRSGTKVVTDPVTSSKKDSPLVLRVSDDIRYINERLAAQRLARVIARAEFDTKRNKDRSLFPIENEIYPGLDFLLEEERWRGLKLKTAGFEKFVWLHSDPSNPENDRVIFIPRFSDFDPRYSQSYLSIIDQMNELTGDCVVKVYFYCQLWEIQERLGAGAPQEESMLSSGAIRLARNYHAVNFIFDLASKPIDKRLAERLAQEFPRENRFTDRNQYHLHNIGTVRRAVENNLPYIRPILDSLGVSIGDHLYPRLSPRFPFTGNMPLVLAHRDLSDKNMIISSDGMFKILDPRRAGPGVPARELAYLLSTSPRSKEDEYAMIRYADSKALNIGLKAGDFLPSVSLYIDLYRTYVLQNSLSRIASYHDDPETCSYVIHRYAFTIRRALETLIPGRDWVNVEGQLRHAFGEMWDCRIPDYSRGNTVADDAMPSYQQQLAHNVMRSSTPAIPNSPVRGVRSRWTIPPT